MNISLRLGRRKIPGIDKLRENHPNITKKCYLIIKSLDSYFQKKKLSRGPVTTSKIKQQKMVNFTIKIVIQDGSYICNTQTANVSENQHSSRTQFKKQEESGFIKNPLSNEKGFIVSKFAVFFLFTSNLVFLCVCFIFLVFF